LGANGTEALQVLLDDGDAALVDYLKVGPFMGREAVVALAGRYPLMLHLDDTLSGHQPTSEETVERLNGWIRLTGTPWTSEHIGFGVPDVNLDSALITQPASALLSRAQALENIVRHARALNAQLKAPLLLENIPFFPNTAHVHVCEPDFVSEAIARSDCDLVLDLAHARVSASMLGLDVHAYLEALPLQRTVEIHLSGPRRLDEVDARRQRLVRENAHSVAHLVKFGEESLMDAHEALREEDYALLAWALARTQPRAISLEYYREPVGLREQLLRLGKMLGR
jgi:uncharacterized protein (UPF0276 family)